MVRTTFATLHDGPGLLRLVNAWDPFSARVLAAAGAPAIGTTSFGVALANGFGDGQRLPWPAMRDVIVAVVAAVDVPVTADIVAGWDDVAATVTDVVEAGAVGVNLEDSRPDVSGELYAIGHQSDRIAEARAAGGPDLFVNARCDVWFGAVVPEGDKLDIAAARAEAYVAAGADGIFLPGLVDAASLRVVADAARAPLNVMLDPRLPSDDELVAAGVRRISQGGGAFLATLQRLDDVARLHLEGAEDPRGGDVPAAFGLIGGLIKEVGT